MGAGIAQLAAQSGHPVRLFDGRPARGSGARAHRCRPRRRGQARPHRCQPSARRCLARITAVDDFAALAGCGLVVEAIVESSSQAGACSPSSRPSSSRTPCSRPTPRRSRSPRSRRACAAAAGGRHALLQSGAADGAGRGRSRPRDRPGARHAMHRDRRGLGQDPGRCADRRRASSSTASRGRSTPRRCACWPSGAPTPATIDALLREAGGFAMGPFELMDLIGHDVNLSVTDRCSRPTTRSALRAVADPAGAGRGRPPRPQERARLLRLPRRGRRRRGDRARRPPAPADACVVRGRAGRLEPLVAAAARFRRRASSDRPALAARDARLIGDDARRSDRRPHRPQRAARTGRRRCCCSTSRATRAPRRSPAPRRPGTTRSARLAGAVAAAGIDVDPRSTTWPAWS